MKEIEKAYEAQKYEDDIYKKWEESGVFSPQPDTSKKPFTVSMPPPNATGVLHLGHATMLAIEDIMIRYKRMQGYAALWVPGTDHAGIATQNRVETNLLEKGITRHDLGRKKFLKEVNTFVKGSRSTIRNQIRKMGASCDWTRERYTLDEGLSKAVREVFVRMFNDGLIYRGDRIVNWCPRCSSTLADDEVDYKDKHEKLYWIKYGPFRVATTRPETILGDTAVAVHPDDKRYKDMIGKEYKISGVLGDFEITVVADKEVDMEFGTGAIKVTPAHSFADFEIAQRHDLPSKSVIDEDGKMKGNCGKYAGMTTLECRKEIVKDMEKMGFLEKTEDFNHNLSICYRCKTPIEPLVSRQWFIAVDEPVIKEDGKKKTIKEKALEVVRNGDIEIIPERFSKTYFHWMENLHDWCISRQIWFGHQIPVWYCQDCNEITVATETPEKCTCGSSNLKQDPDTLDTWFSSGLWTFSTLGWPEKTKDLDFFHPTAVLETGYDILFFWIARMIIMTTYVMKEVPFEKVYLHGLIRTRDGKKMSKSDPATCIDPLDMIEQYGTDALRLSMVIGSTPGNDLRLYEEKIAGYRNFVNKIWNAARFSLMNIEEEAFSTEFDPQKHIKSRADKWILTKLQYLIKDVTNDMEKFRYSDAGTKNYNFTWCELCDWYVEFSKGKHLNPVVLLYVLKNVLKLMHPFVPFVTEVLWGHLQEEKMLIEESWPVFNKKLLFDKEVEEMEILHQIISDIRSVRAQYSVEPAKKIHAVVYAGKYTEFLKKNMAPLRRMARIGSIDILEKGDKLEKAVCVFVSDIEVYLPLNELVDIEKEKKRLMKEQENLQGFKEQLEHKLKNKGFIDNAPKDIVEKEKKRLEETEKSLKKIKGQLEQL
ncbi:valine--tRNA ligase [Candidatus Peregrinibacteria bacterium]|nr:valine--tRNA ligase [Candidatus Peregrinibacteria bacterium]